MRPLAGTILVLVGLLLAGCSCGRGPLSPPPSLLLVTVDTLRADRLGCYGRTGARTPSVDALAREGTRFETALTPLPRTTPAIASILTGLMLSTHRSRGLMSSLPPEVPTLAGWLRARGRRTGAFTSNLFLRPGSGFGSGFEVYSNPRSRWSGNSAREVTDEALEWIGTLGKDEPFFVWVHYLDPHWTYDPPPPFDTLFDPGFPGPWPYTKVAAGHADQGKIIFQNPMSPREVDHAVALYEGEIAATDAQLGRLIESLAGSGRLDRTLVVYTSDHGESLGEHDYYFDHGEYLYEGTLRVPLILRWPGRVPAGKLVTRMARLTDIAPTALALLGETLPSGLDGRSLADDLTASPSPADRDCWIESDHTYVRPENPRHFLDGIEGKWRGIRGERYKLIFVPHDASGLHGEVELYDLKEDPGETHNLERERPELAAMLLARLRAYWLKHGSAAGAAGEGEPVDAEILRSLGYL